jgi:capsular polysaccharide biosynthesis protein
MNLILSSPSLDDLIRLLKAWRFWVLGAILGMALGAAFYYIAPPPYRGKAVVNVDFNLEEAFPQNTDRQDFYYLERESRKMVELAWDDFIISQLSSVYAITNDELRNDALHLSQPAEAGWNFYADNKDPQVAAEMASTWADAFVEKVQSEIAAGNINSFVKLEKTSSQDKANERSIPISTYMLAGSMAFLALAVFFVLFTKPK